MCDSAVCKYCVKSVRSITSIVTHTEGDRHTLTLCTAISCSCCGFFYLFVGFIGCCIVCHSFLSCHFDNYFSKSNWQIDRFASYAHQRSAMQCSSFHVCEMHKYSYINTPDLLLAALAPLVETQSMCVFVYVNEKLSRAVRHVCARVWRLMLVIGKCIFIHND